MAAPNLLSLTTATGVTVAANVTTTAANVVTNSSSSNKVYRLNSLIFTSMGAANTTVSAFVNNGTRTPANTYLVNETVLVANAMFVALDKNTVVYLQEGESLYVKAAANSACHVTVSYEDLS